MIQFVCMNAQAGVLLYTECKTFPRNITVAYLYYILTLLFLFGQFFAQSYLFKSDKKASKSSKGLKDDAKSEWNRQVVDSITNFLYLYVKLSALILEEYSRILGHS